MGIDLTDEETAFLRRILEEYARWAEMEEYGVIESVQEKLGQEDAE